MLPTVRWKASKYGKDKMLLEQGNMLRLIYYFAIFSFTAINVIKGVMFFTFILSRNSSGQFLNYFLSWSTPPSSTEITQQLARSEGAFTLLIESTLIIINVFTMQTYRPIVISVRDAIFYRNQMVADVYLALLDEFCITYL